MFLKHTKQNVHVLLSSKLPIFKIYVHKHDFHRFKVYELYALLNSMGIST